MKTTTINSTVPGNTNGNATINGLKMYYETHGTGSPLVLIHGGGSTTQTTEGMPQPLKDAFPEINPDTNALHRMYERDFA